MTSPIDRLAKMIAKMQKDIRDLQRAPRLEASSFEGAIRNYDDAGTPRVQLGLLPDGTHGLAAFNDGEWKWFPRDLGTGGGPGGEIAINVAFKRDRFVLDSATPTLNLSFLPWANSAHVYLDGVEQDEGTDYTLVGSSLAILAPMSAVAGQIVNVRYAASRPAGDSSDGDGTTEPVTDYRGAVLADSPALYWTLGDPAGSTTTHDSSGNGRNGYIGGGYDPIDFGYDGLVAGSADTCANVTWDRVIRDTEPWMDWNEFSLEVIIRSTDLGGGTLWARHDWGTGQKAFYLRVDNDGSGRLVFARGAGADTFIYGSTNVADGDVHHIAATFDGTTLRLYVDGVLDVEAPMDVLNVASTPLWLGGYYASGWGTDNYSDFIGQMQHAAVYTHAVSAARIAAHAELVFP